MKKHRDILKLEIIGMMSKFLSACLENHFKKLFIENYFKKAR